MTPRMMAEVSKRAASTAVAHRQQSSIWGWKERVGFVVEYYSEKRVYIRLVKHVDWCTQH